MAEQTNNEINIELSEEIADGIYANLAIIAHSHSEFVVDFVRILPNLPKAKVKARIILTPEHAKRLMQALSENIQKFEAQHGKINPSNSNNNVPPFPIGFNSQFGQA